MSKSGIPLIDPQKVFALLPLEKGMRVADLGCGRTGNFVFSAVQIVGDRGLVYGVDILKNVLEGLRSRTKYDGIGNVQLVWSDLEKVGKTTIPDGTLDVCFLVNVMWQMKDKGSVLIEAARLLHSGGKLAVVDWEKKLENFGPPNDLMINGDMLVDQAAAVGLIKDKKVDLNGYHFCLIFTKN